jgi:DNA-binding SARP family transcriptional activator/tetratricopeptide (TPR) repeat protein
VLEVRVCGGVEVSADRLVLPDALFGGRQGRVVFAFLVCERHRAVRREELADLLWPEPLPESWSASLSAVVSRLRRLLTEAGLDGSSALVSAAGSYQLVLPPDATVDIEQLATAVAEAETAADAGDVERAVQAASAAEHVAARGFLTDDCDWVDQWRARVHDLRVRAALARSVAHLAAGSSGRAVDAARDALALDPSREAAFRQVMRTLAAAGERGEALRVWERCRITLVDELGVDPAPETEAVYLEILGAGTAAPAALQSLPSGVVTFLLTDIVESSAMWEEQATAMAAALERHDAIVGEVVAAHGGTLLKSKLEGDATVSVFARATEGATAALAVLRALAGESWPAGKEPRVRMAMHTGEAFERGGDYFGPALNRAARLRSLAGAGEVLLSQAVAELVRDHLPAGVELRDRGHRDLRGLSRGENVYQLAHTQDPVAADPPDAPSELARPPVPSALTGAGPFVGRGDELAQLTDLWDRAVDATLSAAFVGGEPGVGKSRLAGEVAARAHAAGALVLYGRCDEDLAAPLQPFIEAVRTLVPALGAARLRTVRGVDELRRFVPALDEVLGDSAPEMRADPDTERLALFDAVTQLMRAASAEAPVLLVLDDLHWAGKTTLSLLRHVLREAKGARLLIVGTYRDTELARTHPLAATLADLRRDADTHRIALSGLAAADVDAYLEAIGNTDRALGRELAEVTSGNPFFLIEVLRHVADAGGAWEPGTLPEGVREATGRRLSRLSDATNDALAVAAVVGTTFDLALVEQVRGTDLIEPIAEACRAGLVVEEPGALARFRFAHALVRQVLLAELVTLKRVRLHRTIAELLEAAPAAGDPDARLADLAYHWFECASTGSADKAVEACRRAAERALERLAYEEAGDLYAMALQALEAVEDVDPDEHAALHLARCDALLTAGDVAAARGAIDALELAARGSERLAAWYTTYEGLLAVLAEPDRLTEIVQSIGAAAGAMRAVGDLRGEAKAHYVYAAALERLGQIGAAERALDAALAAARGAGDPRLANTILAEAPPAALWGPSPVTRASGRCLDVVRVLRITSGAPAVESVALRCQAVLEALRGRVDAARRMIGSARRTVEQLGLTHRRLETEVAAGFIELLDGEAGAAETYLRDAYEELRDRGLGGEAAQAGAFLGQALLLQGRVDEADEVAAEAERLAGADLKAGIAWRDVRAEAAARRGDTTRALALAREAVELASATDALLLVADARLTLAGVLRAAGDTDAADAEAQRAVEACEAKGATVLAARARSAMTVQPAAHNASVDDRGAPTVHDRVEMFENDLTRTIARVHAGYRTRDWEAIRSSYADDYVQDDRRSVVSMPLNHEQSLAGARMIFDGGGWLDRKTIATRGRSLAVGVSTLHIPAHGAIASVLMVTRTDDAGRQQLTILFDADDIDGATAELDRLFLEGEGAAHADVLDLVTSFVGALCRGDVKAAAASADPDFVVRDHRLFASPPQSTAEWVPSLQDSLDRLDDGGRVRLEHVLRLSEHGCVFSYVHEGAVSDGVGFEVRVLMALRVRDGHFASLDTYDEDDVEAACAALDARRTDPQAERFANAAWRALLPLNNESSLQAFLDALAPGFEIHDNRTGVHIHSSGEAALDIFRLLHSLDDWTIERSLVATRGDRLALVEERTRFVDGAVGESELLILDIIEVDANGLILTRTGFDANDLDGAYDALDARYFELGGPDLRWAPAAFDARDWARYASFVEADAWIDDRRRAGDGRVDRDWLVAYQRAMHDLAPDVKLRIDHADAASPDTMFVVSRWIGTREGGPFEMFSVSLTSTGSTGLISSVTLYDIDDLDAARADYARRTAPSLDDHFPSLAARASRRLGAAANARDWDAFTATLAPLVKYHDRRMGLAVELIGDDARASWRPMFDVDELRLDNEVIATRGERLALVHAVAVFRDGETGPAEAAGLVIVETDAELVTHYVAFDPDDMTSALDELDARSATLGAFSLMATMRQSFDARDWDTFASALTEDCTIVDSRTAGWGSVDREVFVDYQRSVTDLADDAHLWIDHIRERGKVSISTGRAFGTSAGGGWEIAFVTVGVADEEGRARHFETYEVGDMAVALARFHELVAQDEAEPAANSAWRAAETQARAVNTQNWDALAATLAPHFQHDSRRTGVGLVTRGKEAVAIYRYLFTLDRCRQERVLLATRGDHLALLHSAVTFEDGVAGPAEIKSLHVCEVDDRALMTHAVTFDEDDLTAALAELEARYAALARFHELVADEEAQSSGNAAWRVVCAQTRAVNEHRWEAFAEALAPELEHDDRRSLVGRVDRGPDAFARVRWTFALDDIRLETTLLATRGDRLVLSRTAATFHDGATGSAEVVCLNVTQVNEHGLVTHMLLFDDDDAQRAHAELEARHAQSSGNAAWRAVCAQRRAVNEQSWGAFVATLAPDFEQDDRRSVVGQVDRGSDALAAARTIFDHDDVRSEETLLATRGDRLVLVRTTVTFRYGVELTPAEIVCLNVNQVNEHGLVTHCLVFDDDDAQGAENELEARHLALGGSRPRRNRAWATVERAMRAFERHEWDSYAACLHPQLVSDDRRRGVLTQLTGDEAVAVMRMGFEMTDGRWYCNLLATAGDRVALVEYNIRGAVGVAGELEVRTLQVVEIDDDERIVQMLGFDTDERDMAEAEMQAVGASSPRSRAIPHNLAARSVEQPGWTLLTALADNLCLHSTADGLVLHEVDETGHVMTRLGFGQDRRAAADEIARRYNEQMGFPPSAVRMSSALNAHDLGAVRECMSDSCAVEDNRRLRLAHLRGPDEHIAMLASAIALAPDYFVEVLRDVAVERWGNVIAGRSSGTAIDGGPFETEYIALAVWDTSGQLVRLGVYEPEDADAAIERLRALGR